jgi:signal transduction histidine kinase
MSQAKILIVEDEGLIANDIAFQLTRSGYNVLAIASSGEGALNLLQNMQPDLVLMDIRLSGDLDGIDTAARVRSEYRLPVIFLTSHADVETLARAKQVTPSGYVVKPFRQVNLCSAIEMAIFKHKSDLALLDREALIFTVLQSTSDPMIVVNPQGCVQFLNFKAEQLLQRTLAQCFGFKWTEVMFLVDPNGTVLEDLSSLRDTEFLPGTVIRRPDQSELAIEGAVAPSYADGALAGLVITIRDVSRRREQEAKQRQEQKMVALGRLASGVAHDFNNILTVIIGHVSQLKSSDSSSDSIARIDAVIDAANTAAGVTRQLLTMSGNVVMESEELDVNDRIQHLMALMNAALGSHIATSTILDSSTGKIRMNGSQFDQILMNLLMNARDAMPSGGNVTISTSNIDHPSTQENEVVDSYVRIVVKDSGPGIPAETQEHIFDPFFTTKSQGVNCGLGLSIIYGIVKDAGGQINVRSAVGLGAEFEVLLPRVDSLSRVGLLASTVHAKQWTAQTPARTILLAEDDSIVRELLSSYLGDLGFNLIVAVDGQEAIEAADKYAGHIDLLLSDVRMPRLDGMALVQLMSVSRPETKALLMSGYIGDSAKFTRETRSTVSFIEKPFLPPSLLEKVNQLTA